MPRRQDETDGGEKYPEEMKDNALKTGEWEEGGASSYSRGLDFKILDGWR